VAKKKLGKLGKKVLSGALTVDEARAKLGRKKAQKFSARAERTAMSAQVAKNSAPALVKSAPPVSVSEGYANLIKSQIAALINRNGDDWLRGQYSNDPYEREAFYADTHSGLEKLDSPDDWLTVGSTSLRMARPGASEGMAF
jgi:hypothetical protein